MAYGIDPNRLSLSPDEVLMDVIRRGQLSIQEEELKLSKKQFSESKRQFDEELQYKEELAQQKATEARNQLIQEQILEQGRSEGYMQREALQQSEAMRRLETQEAGKMERLRFKTEAEIAEETATTEKKTKEEADKQRREELKYLQGWMKTHTVSKSPTGKEGEQEITSPWDETKKYYITPKAGMRGANVKEQLRQKVAAGGILSAGEEEALYGREREEKATGQDVKDNNFVVELKRNWKDFASEDEMIEEALERGIDLSEPKVQKAIESAAAHIGKQISQEEVRGEAIKVVGRGSAARFLKPGRAYTGYTQEQEDTIQENMNAHGKSRVEVIAALKRKGYL